MSNFKKGIVMTLAGALTLGAVGVANAEGPRAKAERERNEARARARAEAERSENKQDHPEVWNAIKALRKARDEVEYSRNEKQKYKDAALKSINTALAELEQLLARD
jgi:regulator of protease activity HflC (stomatin/prohibitin superfamily)